LISDAENLMLSDWVSFLAYPNLFGIKGFLVVVVLISDAENSTSRPSIQIKRHIDILNRLLAQNNALSIESVLLRCTR
jgi:hypothetical protein